MAGNIEIKADLGTLGQFQASFMAPKIPSVSSSISTVLVKVIGEENPTLISMIKELLK